MSYVNLDFTAEIIKSPKVLTKPVMMEIQSVEMDAHLSVRSRPVSNAETRHAGSKLILSLK